MSATNKQNSAASGAAKGRGLTISDLKDQYSYLVEPAQKKQFITKYKPIIEKSGNAEYKKFLNSCIMDYNAACRNASNMSKTQSKTQTADTAMTKMKGLISNTFSGVVSSVSSSVDKIEKAAKNMISEVSSGAAPHTTPRTTAKGKAKTSRVMESPQFKIYLQMLEVINSIQDYTTRESENSNDVFSHSVLHKGQLCGAITVFYDNSVGGLFGDTQLGSAINKGSNAAVMDETLKISKNILERTFFGLNVKKYLFTKMINMCIYGYSIVLDGSNKPPDNEWINTLNTSFGARK